MVGVLLLKNNLFVSILYLVFFLKHSSVLFVTKN